MKKMCVLVAALLALGAAFAMGQPVAGKKFELGTAVTFFSLNPDNSDTTLSYLSLPVRFGWFAWKGLEIEPEIVLTVPLDGNGETTTYFLLGHVAYHFKTSGKLVPFVGAGAGFGNGISVSGVVQGGAGNSTSVFDGLAGVKYIIGGMAALRLEYRISGYTSDAGDDEVTKGVLHHVFLGLSIFF